MNLKMIWCSVYGFIDNMMRENLSCAGSLSPGAEAPIQESCLLEVVPDVDMTEQLV